MLYNILFIILGALIAAGIIWQTKRRAGEQAPTYFAVYLSVAAFIYVLFWLKAPTTSWLFIELSGVLLYTGIAWAGVHYKKNAWVGAGWLLHVLWDVLLHSNGHPGYVPYFYPALCIGFDLVLGTYLLFPRDHTIRQLR